MYNTAMIGNKMHLTFKGPAAGVINSGCHSASGFTFYLCVEKKQLKKEKNDKESD